MWMRPRAPRLAQTTEEGFSSPPSCGPLTWTPHPSCSSVLISLVHLQSCVGFPFLKHTDLNSWWLTEGLTVLLLLSFSVPVQDFCNHKAAQSNLILRCLLLRSFEGNLVARSGCFSSQVLFSWDKRGHGPVTVDKNAKQPWSDQTGCFLSYLASHSTVCAWDDCL